MSLLDFFNPFVGGERSNPLSLWLVPVGLRFGGGRTVTQVVQAPKSRPPAAPPPIAPETPTQSVAQILTRKRKPGLDRSGTILTGSGGNDGSGGGRRTILGFPVA